MRALFPLPLVLLAATAGPVAAQVITIRSVPISQAHQFDLFPSQRMGMGGVRLAVTDSLLDPVSNPALGAGILGSRFFGSPGVYNVSANAGGGRSLPLGAWVRSGNWFGGAVLAVQQIDLSQTFTAPVILDVLRFCPACQAPGTTLTPGDRTPGNAFGYASLGYAFPGSSLSVGGSVYWSGLHGVDGVDLLYPGNARLDQDGHALDMRFGVAGSWAGDRTFNAVMLHRRFASTHDVFYLDQFWDPSSQSFGFRPRLEENLDHTNSWGLHAEYSQPLAATGWRMGWAATTNLMQHPKIPNYEIQNIPRDPGNSEAFNLGVGLARTEALATFAIDLVYEPIWSHTWADAAAPVVTTAGHTIPAGGKTIENRFTFHNAHLRLGLSQDLPFDQETKAFGVQLGLAVTRIDYNLKQDDNVQLTTRRQHEDWVEWSPTWGLSLRFPAWEIRYRGSILNGTGRPGVAQGGGDILVAVPEAGSTILVAPSGPLTLAGVKVTTHQVALTFPLGSRRTQQLAEKE